MTPSKLQVSLLLCSLALLFPCFVNGKYYGPDIDKVGKMCNATKEDVQVLKNYDIPSTEIGKCLMKCLTVKLGMVDALGKYSKDGTDVVFKEYWPEMPLNIRSAIIDKCYNEALKISNELGTCDYYYKIEICFNSELKRYGMF
ncbi:Hypothetical protein CINCED_3A005583 [Cinara cedri]|nr:Hypothetical protein CINCED_3A005583 [Cinara cedri]